MSTTNFFTRECKSEKIKSVFDLESDDLTVFDPEFRRELLRRKSSHCLSREDRKLNNELKNTGRDIASKILIITLSSMIMYYGLFTIILPRLIVQIGIDPIIIKLIMGSFIAAFLISLVWFVHKGNYGRTQFIVYTIIYTSITLFGIIIYFINNFNISSYQLLNMFFFILTFQILVIFVSSFITKKMICRI